PGLADFRRQALAGVPKEERIVFAPPNPVYTVTVFTDVECGYCRRMHDQIAEYNRQGIAVEYLAFPRMGMASQDFRDMVSVWCAPDRRQALTRAKTGQPARPAAAPARWRCTTRWASASGSTAPRRCSRPTAPSWVAIRRRPTCAGRWTGWPARPP